MSIIYNKFVEIGTLLHLSIVGSVVECSPATRAARVRFPDDAYFFHTTCLYYVLYCKMKIFATSGYRTRAARVAGEHSTTEPTLLTCSTCLTKKVNQNIDVHNS